MRLVDPLECDYDQQIRKKQVSFVNREALADPNLVSCHLLIIMYHDEFIIRLPNWFYLTKEWVVALLDDLEAMEDNIYKKLFKQRIDKMLGAFTINMDPSNYRRLYRDKAFRETLNLPTGDQRVSTQIPLQKGGTFY